MTVIGIDLGTTTSGVCVVRDNQLHQIPQDSGDYLMPSVVHFESDGTWQVGVEALDQITTDRENTIFDIKRIIGYRPTESVVREAASRLPYRISTEHSKTKIIIRQNHGDRLIEPEYISSLILRKLKETVERNCTEPITKVVVTVPATFTVLQREATKEACRLAGLNNYELLNEPTAAIFSYNAAVPFPDDCKILVFDLGGGTFDLSAIEYQAKNFQVKCVHGEPYLGGRDFDNHLMEYCLREFQNDHPCESNLFENCDLSALRYACEKAKKWLTFNETAKIRVRSFYNGIDLCMNVSRSKFESLIDLLCQKLRVLTEELLNTVKWRAEEINFVFPIGGSVQIPKIQKLLKEMFTSEQIRHALNPDLAVLNGAAWYASRFERKNTQPTQPTQTQPMREVVRLGIGIADSRGSMSFFIAPNSPLPITYQHPVVPSHEQQTDVQLDIYEGNDPLVKKNQLIGRLRLPFSRRVEFNKRVIFVTFHMDSQGLLYIRAVDNCSGREKCLTLEYSPNQ